MNNKTLAVTHTHHLSLKKNWWEQQIMTAILQAGWKRERGRARINYRYKGNREKRKNKRTGRKYEDRKRCMGTEGVKK